MFSFLGTPLLVKGNFNSFIPNNLNENLKNIINYYLNEFKKTEFYFDKVESELALSNIDLALEKN